MLFWGPEAKKRHAGRWRWEGGPCCHWSSQGSDHQTPTAFAATWRHPKKAELYAVNPTDLAECEASTRRTSHLGVTFDRFFGVLGSWKLLFFLEGARLWEGWWYQLPHWFPHCKKLSSDASQMTDLNEMKTCIFRHIFIKGSLAQKLPIYERHLSKVKSSRVVSSRVESSRVVSSRVVSSRVESSI